MGAFTLYYPICEVVDLLHCGRQKTINALAGITIMRS